MRGQLSGLKRSTVFENAYHILPRLQLDFPLFTVSRSQWRYSLSPKTPASGLQVFLLHRRSFFSSSDHFLSTPTKDTYNLLI